MLTCRDASRLVSEGQERQLGLWERLGLRLHLWMCVHCRRFEGQIHLLRRALQRLGTRTAQTDQLSDLSVEARERLRKAVANRVGDPH